MSLEDEKTVHQSIHPDMLERLDPEYIIFHNRYIAHLIPDPLVPWQPAYHRRAPWPCSTLPVVPVHSTLHLQPNNCDLKIFSPGPVAAAPAPGWPVFIWFHGGGWVLGSSSSNDEICTRICAEVQAVVISVGYKLAPENVYPSAMTDARETLRWAVSNEAVTKLNIDTNNIGVGGTSSGGGLAAALSMDATLVRSSCNIKYQVLAVPVLDNTAHANAGGRWEANKHAPWLTPQKMIWFRKLYMPEESDWCKWDASPLLADTQHLARSPQTWIGIAELDILAQEAFDFAALVQAAWDQDTENQSSKNTVDVKVYPGVPHAILGLNGVLTRGNELVHDIVAYVKAKVNGEQT